MRILSWNILHGGGQRVRNIVDSIKEHAPDIVCFQEFRHGKSKPILLDGLKSLGLDQIYSPDSGKPRDNTILVASRYDFEAETFPEKQQAPTKAIQVKFHSPELNLVIVHIPHKKKQIPFFIAMHELPKHWLQEASLLVGDFNCGIPFEDSETKSFDNTHMFQHLLQQGWIDAWRSRNTKAREFTWISTKNRYGFRYDHALVSRTMNANIEKIYYDHTVRDQGVSDHSLMMIEL